MENTLEFKEFDHSKSLDELLYENAKITTDLSFKDSELKFLKYLIKTYPFKNNIQNLFERIQLYSREIDKLNDERVEILNEIRKHEKELKGMVECDSLSCDNLYIKRQQKLAATLFNYCKKYQDFKIELYQFISGIIN